MSCSLFILKLTSPRAPRETTTFVFLFTAPLLGESRAYHKYTAALCPGLGSCFIDGACFVDQRWAFQAKYIGWNQAAAAPVPWKGDITAGAVDAALRLVCSTRHDISLLA